MIDTTPWWRIDAKTDPGRVRLAKSIESILSASGNEWMSTTEGHYLLSWMYYRDRYLAQYGSYTAALGHLPQTVRSNLGWLNGIDDKQTPRFPSPNIVRSSVDTVTAWLFSQHPLVGIDSSGVPFEERFKVQDYENALDGLFNTRTAAAAIESAARDAALSGVGYAWPRLPRGNITIERLHPWQVVYDPYDARSGDPTTVHVLERRDRAAIVAWVRAWRNLEGAEKAAEAIENMTPFTSAMPSSSDMLRGSATLYDLELQASRGRSDAEQLTVLHSYRVATSDDGDDGRHVVTVFDAMGTSQVAMDYVYKRTTLPVVPFRAMPNDEGIGGTGFGHLMRVWQEQIDYCFWKIQRLQRDYGWPRLAVERSMAKEAQQLTARDVSTIIVPDGTNADPKMRWLPQGIIDQHDITWAEKLLVLSQSIHGINSMMSRGASQLGANASGQALQEEHYRSLDRFTPLVNAHETFRLRLAEECLHLVDDAVALDPGYKATYEWGGRRVSTTWAKLQRSYRTWSVSLELRGANADSRASRTARVQELAAQGSIDTPTARDALLNTPDLRMAARLNSAGYNYVLWQLRGLIELPKDADPSEFFPDGDTPYELAIQLATRFIQLARVDGANPETLARLREYKIVADGQLTLLSPPQVSPAGLGGAAPQPPLQ